MISYAIRIISKELSTFNFPYNDVVECCKSFYSEFSWHINHLTLSFSSVNCKYLERPQNPTLVFGCLMVMIISFGYKFLLTSKDQKADEMCRSIVSDGSPDVL